MLLSELKTGEKGVIVKVFGHGGFRKRIVEMGFIRGKLIEVMLNAPLKDPIKYKLMGYEVSLRRQEAELIEVITEEEAEIIKKERQANGTETPKFHITEEELAALALEKRRTINVALVGNPNSGKTSLFNVASGAHERVGNYSGVTVDAKEGHFTFQGYDFKIVDLPGTYSLSAYTPEELYVRRHIVQELPDIIINVVDASNIERNLYLTTQLIDMNVRMIVALNMYDELEASGNKLDFILLSQLLGVPMIPTISKTNWGIDNLFHVIINLYEGADYMNKDGEIDPEIVQYIKSWHEREVFDKKHQPQPDDYAHLKQKEGMAPKKVFRHIHINHGPVIEQAIASIQDKMLENEELRAKFSTRFLSIKLLEKDKDVEKLIKQLPDGEEIIEIRDQEAESIHSELREDSESAIVNAKYGFIEGALQETFIVNQKEKNQQTKIIDTIVLNKYLGYPLFFVILCAMFILTFLLGKYPMEFIEWGVSLLGDWVSDVMSAGPLKDLIVDGVVGGVGAVIVFLPNILILYLIISFLEDSGYMARAAFIMDKLMHKIGLHGKSFIPLVMGFGCNVPSIMATRTIESHKSRLITILINPFMSCSARLPVYLMLIGVIFPKDSSLHGALMSSLTLVGIYFIGIAIAAISAKIFSKWMFKEDDVPFVMELPPYRMPTGKAILRHSWEKGKQYLKKMGGIILVASIVVWFLGYFPNHDKYETVQEQQENSYLGKIGQTIEPVIRPLGFDWKMGIGIVAGVGAKEVVASTLAIVYNGAEDEQDNLPIKPFNAFVYMLFILIYFPCIAAIIAIKKETGGWKYPLFSMCYSTGLAWVLCFVVYQVGMLF